MPSNYTDDASGIARAIKGIERDLSNLKADVRGRDDPVNVVRQSHTAAETYVLGATLKVYDAADVVTDDWDTRSRRQKRWTTFRERAVRTLTRSSRTTTEAFHEWLGAVLDRNGGPLPAETLHIGGGDPSTHEPAMTTLDDETHTVPIVDGVYRGDNDGVGVGEVSTFLDYDELVGVDITELGVDTEMDDRIVGLAGFERNDDGSVQYTKQRGHVVDITFQIGVRDAVEHNRLEEVDVDGVVTDGFARRAGYMIHPGGLSVDPILTASIGTDPDPPLDRREDRWSVSYHTTEVPVTNASMVEPSALPGDDPAEAPHILAFTAYIDAGVATDESLTEIGLVAGSDDGADDPSLVTWSMIDPSAERTSLETLSVETTVELFHASASR